MEFSIYRQLTPKADLIQYLRDKEMSRVGDTQTFTNSITVEEEEIQKEIVVDYFFKLDSDDAIINWATYWGPFFSDPVDRTKTIESAYGIIVIEIEENLFVISLGRAHSLANNFADYDFGFDMAEIIHDKEAVEVKSSKFFKQTKNKSLTQYNTNSYVTSEIGESNELIISKIQLADKYSAFHLFSYNKRIKFGTAIKIEVDDYVPNNILSIVHELSYLLFHEEKSGNLPRMVFLKNNEDNQYKFSDLNERLLTDLKSEPNKVNLSYYIEDDGDIFLNPIEDGDIEILYDRRVHALASYSIESLSELINNIECTDISKVTIRSSEYPRDSKPLLKILDYGVEYQRKDYYLFKGRWASFNKSYLEYINREISKVNECIVIVDEYNLTEEVLEAGREIQKSDTEKYDRVLYSEYPYNIFLENKYHHILLDRRNQHDLFKNVEFADLFNEEEESLIHVKIGSTPEIRYCIQQSLRSSEIFNTQSDVLEVYGIERVKKISMLLVIKSRNMFLTDEIFDFGRNNSIYFKIEIIEWLTKVRSLGYLPEIIICKDLRGTANTAEENIPSITS